jgi:prefoldin subunit 5
MATKYPRGSEWRKWDLHFHTQSSHDYDNKSITNTDIIDTLKRNNIAVVAITDHHIIDIDRIKDLKRLAGDEITILPGIEILSDARGKEPLHFIGIFPEDCNIEYIWAQLENKTNLCRIKGEHKKHNEIYCDLLKTVALIHELGGIVSIHAGTKSNGIEKISNRLPHIMAQKEDIAKCVDVFELGKPEDQEDYRNIVFPSIKRVLPMVLCSDNHNITDYTLKQNCWVKADPTFNGLLQILYEPEDRVRIQEVNPNLDFEKSPFTNIRISNKTHIFEDKTDNTFFTNQDIPLNSNLISIIGGRGTGKSVLIDYIATAFNKSDSKHYDISPNLVVSRQKSLTEESISHTLSDRPNVPFMYISQSQIKDLVADKIRFTQNIRETIGVTDEYTSSPNYKSQVDDTFNEYFRIFNIVEEKNLSSEQKKANINQEIRKYTELIANITSSENKTKLENYQKYLENLQRIDRWLESITNLKVEITTTLDNINSNITSLNDQLKSDELHIPNINAQSTIDHIDKILLPRINNSKIDIQKRIEDTKKTFENFKGDITTLLSNVGEYQSKVLSLQNNLQEIEKEEQKYQEIKTTWFKNLGDQIRQSIENYTTLIVRKWEHFKAGPDSISEDRRILLSTILGRDDLDVSVHIHFDADTMYQIVMQKLDGRRYSTEKLYKDYLKIRTLDDFYNFIQQAEGHLNIFDVSIPNELRWRIMQVFFRDYTQFISHEIIVSSGGKPITKLSHGQQGTIYLRLQLAARAFSETIIYDQPEDDLDNKFIMQDLVTIFKQVKKFRQVIIVSHNANLVVNSDSEQVIIAENNEGILSYTSGALEDPEINLKICEILEGGQTAFLNREQKYQLKTVNF